MMNNLVKITNLQPDEVLGIPFIIPPGQSSATQQFTQSIALDINKFNYIPYISCRIDLTGIYNITIAEQFFLNGVPTTIVPGNYTVAQLQSIFNVVIPTSGAGAYLTTNNQQLQFPDGSKLGGSQSALILGYSSFGSAVIPAGTISTQTVNQTGNNDTILLQCELVGQSNALGANYLAVFNLSDRSPGSIFFDRIFINPPTPILKTSFQTIVWSVQKYDGTPFICNTPIELFYRIASQKKI